MPEWRDGVLVPIFKNKSDVHIAVATTYRGMQLRSHTMKLWGCVVERRIKREVTFSEQQHGFMPGKSTTGEEMRYCIGKSGVAEEYVIIVQYMHEDNTTTGGSRWRWDCTKDRLWALACLQWWWIGWRLRSGKRPHGPWCSLMTLWSLARARNRWKRSWRVGDMQWREEECK